MKTLLLNLDYTPLVIINWTKCIVLQMKKAIIPLEYHTKTIRDGSGRMWPVARVAIIKKYVKRHKVPLSKKNIFLRDKVCVYCGSNKDLTIDHVIPTSKGGKHEWTNVVAACKSCNLKKGNKVPNPMIYPKAPLSVGFGLDLSEWPEYEKTSKKTKRDSTAQTSRTNI